MKTIDLKELLFTYSRSSGAGGQNVNKLNTKVTLSWKIYNSKSISNFVIKRFVAKFGGFLTDEKLIKISSQRFRNQGRNLADCVEKLNNMVDSVRKAPKKRISTKPTRGSVERRIKSKKELSNKKKMRSEKF